MITIRKPFAKCNNGYAKGNIIPAYREFLMPLEISKLDDIDRTIVELQKKRYLIVQRGCNRQRRFRIKQRLQMMAAE